MPFCVLPELSAPLQDGQYLSGKSSADTKRGNVERVKRRDKCFMTVQVGFPQNSVKMGNLTGYLERLCLFNCEIHPIVT